MPKKYVLDTNVMLHDPLAASRFGPGDVVVPIYAIEEVDRFKRELSQRGRNARVFSRYLDDLRAGGKLCDGVPMGEAGGNLRVAMVGGEGGPPEVADEGNRADNLILAVALQEQQQDPDRPVVFVTRDVNLRIRADALGLQAVDYVDERVDISELYSGTTEITVPGTTVDALYADGAVPYTVAEGEDEPFPHQCALVRDVANEGHSALARYDAQNERLVALRRYKDSVWGIRPRNKEQHFAFELLLNDDVKLVTLVGMAGTGKTLLAIAAGLQKVIEERKYQKLLVSRPIFPLGRDVGFLPGDLEEKLNPWMQPIYDNLELLLGVGHSDRNERSYREFLEMGYLEVEPLTYIRGRSIPNQFIIVDEAQNLTPHEVKTIITRVGDNTKIVLTGDPYQIDNPYIDSSNNGLSTVVERFKDAGLSGHMTLLKGERSELAELAANKL
ncbi:MAG: phosphate starvation-inducible protein PhoH [Proteobacteria bacterium]|nr:MAG: phosphate starvation-inducible protein PhoH [Pseudomonadota bacterium]PIE18799.1 MAG: phosphate starvation-inducible protein PhoH [Pseudomonadota bacterium]